MSLTKTWPIEIPYNSILNLNKILTVAVSLRVEGCAGVGVYVGCEWGVRRGVCGGVGGVCWCVNVCFVVCSLLCLMLLFCFVCVFNLFYVFMFLNVCEFCINLVKYYFNCDFLESWYCIIDFFVCIFLSFMTMINCFWL